MNKKPQTSIQESLIGPHPKGKSLFSEWLNFQDTTEKNGLKLRHLEQSPSCNIDKVINQLADFFLKHHVSEEKFARIKSKKNILSKHGYKEYVKLLKLLPDNDKTRKGNFAEIVLSEYLQKTSGLNPIILRLRYNPNVDQSMKGDDVILFDITNVFNRLIVGEAKYRTTIAKKAVEDINALLGGKTRLPISIPFISQVLRDKGQNNLADNLDDLIVQMHHSHSSIINVAFIMSNEKVKEFVQDYASLQNDNLVWLSLAISDPENLVEKVHKNAISKIERR
jgi:hypothetical protein